MTEKKALVADIGGTNARFAIATKNDHFFNQQMTYQCADHQQIESAIDTYIKETGISNFSAFYFAVAGPIQNQTVDFTNNHWLANMPAMIERYGLSAGKLLNDFEAISYSLPMLNSQQITAIGSHSTAPKKSEVTLGVLGPGSGLGVGGIIERANKFYALITEGGHCGFAPETDYQIEILKALRTDFPRVCNENLLSGPGIANLYKAISNIENHSIENIDVKEIGQRFSLDYEAQKTNSIYIKTFNHFFEILGQVAGDIALMQSSFDGIYIAGGICQRYPEAMKNSYFRQGFERKDQHSHLLEQTPTWLITENNPGLIGASIYANQQL